MHERFAAQQVAQNLIASSISVLEQIANDENPGSRDALFSLCNSLSGADIYPDKISAGNFFDGYRAAADGPGSRPYKVAQAVEDIFVVRNEKDSLLSAVRDEKNYLLSAVETLLKELPKEKSRPSIDISKLIDCAETIYLASESLKLGRAIGLAQGLSGSVILYDEKTAEKICELMDKEFRLGYFAERRLRKALEFKDIVKSYEEKLEKVIRKQESAKNLKNACLEYIKQKNELIKKGHSLAEILPAEPNKEDLAENTLYDALKYIIKGTEERSKPKEEGSSYEYRRSIFYVRAHNRVRLDLLSQETLKKMKLKLAVYPALASLASYLPKSAGRKIWSSTFGDLGVIATYPLWEKLWLEEAAATKLAIENFSGLDAASREGTYLIFTQLRAELLKALDKTYDFYEKSINQLSGLDEKAREILDKLSKRLYF